MTKFIREVELNRGIEKLFHDATELILIVSPYIRLHQKIIDVLKTKRDNADLQLIVLFGKNEGDYSKSIDIDDLIFFSTFKNVDILYEPRLHAKYYANEKASIITSMNLYDFSQENNIEIGIFLEASRSSYGNYEKDAYSYFETVVENSKLLFRKVQQEIEENNLKQYIKGDKVNKNHKSYVVEKDNIKEGYCIRCHTDIKLDPKHPLCKKCKDSWDKYKNPEYLENHCHICGKSDETSFIKPTCYKCYKEYKRILSFN